MLQMLTNVLLALSISAGACLPELAGPPDEPRMCTQAIPHHHPNMAALKSKLIHDSGSTHEIIEYLDASECIISEFCADCREKELADEFKDHIFSQNQIFSLPRSRGVRNTLRRLMAPMPNNAEWTFRYKIGSGPQFLDLPTGILEADGTITPLNSWYIDTQNTGCGFWLNPQNAVSYYCDASSSIDTTDYSLIASQSNYVSISVTGFSSPTFGDWSSPTATYTIYIFFYSCVETMSCLSNVQDNFGNTLYPASGGIPLYIPCIVTPSTCPGPISLQFSNCLLNGLQEDFNNDYTQYFFKYADITAQTPYYQHDSVSGFQFGDQLNCQMTAFEGSYPIHLGDPCDWTSVYESQLTINYQDALVMMDNNVPPIQTINYVLGQTPLQIGIPSYTFYNLAGMFTSANYQFGDGYGFMPSLPCTPCWTDQDFTAEGKLVFNVAMVTSSPNVVVSSTSTLQNLDATDLGQHVLRGWMITDQNYIYSAQSFVLIVNVLPCTPTHIVLQEIQTTFYLGSNTTVSIPYPAFTVEPAACQSLVSMTWALSSSTWAITTATGIDVSPTSSELGLQTLTLTATVTPSAMLDLTTVSFKTSTVSIDVVCRVSGIQISSPALDLTYTVNDIPANYFPPTTYSVIPALCQTIISIFVEIDVTSLGLAATNNGYGSFSVFTADSTYANVYSLSWIVTIEGFDTETGSPITVYDPFSFTILSCSAPTITSNTATTFTGPFSYVVLPSPTSLVITMPTYTVNTGICPPIAPIITLASQDSSLTFQSFLTKDLLDTFLTVATSDFNLLGAYTIIVSATAGLTVNTDFQFDVTLTCQVTSFAPILAVAAQSYQLSNTILTIPISYTQVPAGCGLLQILIDVDGTGSFQVSHGFIQALTTTSLAVQSQDNTLTGQHIITLKADIATSTFITGLADTSVQFPIDLICVINSIVPTTLPSPIIVVGAAPTMIPLSGYTTSPACGAMIIQTLSDPSFSVPLMYGIDTSTGANQISLGTSNLADQGTWSLTLDTTVVSTTWILPCNPISETFSFTVVSNCLSISIVSAVSIKITYMIGSGLTQVLFPTYSGQPAGCPLSLTYQLNLIAKTTDSAFINDARFNQPALMMPNFVSLNELAGVFELQGSDFNELWNTYTFLLNAIDSSGVQDNSFTLEVQTTLDCSQGLIFNLPPSLQHSVRYNIGSGLISTFFAPALDSISEFTGLAEVCGPVQYNVTAIDSTGTQQVLFPPFMTFKSTNEIAIWTNDEAFEGSYLLQFEIFLVNFPASPRRQEIVEVFVTNLATYTVQQPIPQNGDLVPFNQSANEPLPRDSTSNDTETFIEGILPPDLKTIQDWKDEVKVLMQKQKQKQKEPNYIQKPPNPFFKLITDVGKVVVGFSSDVFIVPNLSMINNGTIFLDELLADERNLAEKQRVPVLMVEVIPGTNSNSSMLGFSWNATKLSKKNLGINLYFDHPEVVSQSGVSLISLTFRCRKI